MGEELKKEIDDMINGLSGALSAEEPEEEPPKEEPPVEEEPLKEELPKEEPPKEDEPLKEEPPPKEEPDEKDKIIADLRGKLAEKEKPPIVEKPIVEEPLAPEAQDFIGELDLDEVVRDKGAFNKLLNTLYIKGLNDARKVVGEGILRGIPDIVKANINIMSDLKETSDKFYKDNKELVPFKKVVAAVFEEIAAQNPGKKYGDLLVEVGDEARKRLDLHKKAVEKVDDKKVDDKGNPPRLPQKKGGAGDKHEKPNTSPLQDEIGEMNKSIGR